MKYRSINGKIIRSFTLLFVLALVLIVGLFSYVTQREVTAQLKQSAKDSAQLTRDFVDASLISGESALFLMEKENRALPYSDKIVDSMQYANAAILNSFLVYADGSDILRPAANLPADFDPRDRIWYKEAKAKLPEIYWSEPYFDISTNTLVITASKAFYNESLGEEIVIGIDVALSELSSNINNISAGEHGFFMITNKNGKIIAHRDNTLIDEMASDLYDHTPSTPKNGKFVWAETKDGYFITTPAIRGGFLLTSFIDKEDIRTIVLSWLSFLWVSIVAIAFGLYFLSKRVTKSLTKPLFELKKTMDYGATNDELVFCNATADDEVQQLIDGYNRMIEHQMESKLEMTALYEELYASEENLREQYDELYHNREMIQKSEEKYRLLFEASTQGLWDIDEENHLRFYSTKWYEQFDLELDNTTLDDWRALIHRDDIEKVNKTFNDHIRNKTDHYVIEYRVKRKDGNYLWVRGLGKAQFDQQGNRTTIAGSHKDITDEKVYQNEMKHMAYTDHLTGLNNQYRLKETIERAIKHGERGIIFYIDLDNFKYINDTYGHSNGDNVLIEVSRRLNALCNDQMLLARISGDEFALVYQEPPEDFDADEFAVKLLLEVRRKIEVTEFEFYVTASIGVSRYPEDAASYEELLINADISMYKAKEMSKNSFFVYNREMKRNLVQRMKLETKLLKSLDKKALFVHYQPIIDVKINEVIGFEALVRWHDDELGMIYPDDFIPLAERNQYINKIGDFVLEEAIKFGLQLKETYGKYYEQSVNISVVQLRAPGFVDRVAELLEVYQYPSSFLNLEITESLTLERDQAIMDQLIRIRNLGIKLSLDDFGTGYSSLNNLAALPITHLKIDKSVVRESLTNEEIFKLIQSIIDYAHKTSIMVISEGIENIEMLRNIEDLHSDYVQGFMYTKPTTKEEIMRLMDHKVI